MTKTKTNQLQRVDIRGVSVGDNATAIEYDINGQFHRADLTTTVCNYGKVRYWFVCPYCEKRRAILYLGNSGLACRTCYRLCYSIENKTKSNRAIDNTDIQAAFLYEMLHRDISAFNVGKIPDTKALQHQRAQSLDSFGKYWLDVLQRGVIFETQHNIGELKYWIEKPAVDLIRAGYEQWINKNKIQQFGIVSRETMGRHLASWYGAKQRQFMTLIIGESSKGELLTSGSRPYLYAVGAQREAIEAFCKAEKLDATDLLKSID